MKNKVYSNIASKIEKLENQRTADIKRCEEIIAEHESNIQSAEKNITVTTDIDSFLIASESRTKSEAAIKACKDKINLLETEGMISKADYEDDVKAIRSEQQKIADEAFKAIVPLMKQMFELYQDMDSKVNEFNHLIEADAEVAKQNLGVTKTASYHDDKYDLVKGYVGRLKHQMEHHIKLSEYFSDNK